MARIAPLVALGVAAFVSACETAPLGPPPGGLPPAPPMANAAFDPAAFAWSQRPGRNVIVGRGDFVQAAVRYTCAGSSVVLTPETAWSRARMLALYGSTERARLPADEVRARTDRAPPGDAAPYVKRTTCDAGDQFAFANLPDGAWYAIGIARPVGTPNGESLAIMRRVVTGGGRRSSLTF